MFGILVRVGEGFIMRTATRRSQRQRELKIKLTFLCIATLILVFLLGLTFGSILARAGKKDSSANTCKYYANIEVQSGDTLWNLADRYLDANYKSKEAYIEEVIRINSLASENHIVSGQYLVMPYYEAEKGL